MTNKVINPQIFLTVYQNLHHPKYSLSFYHVRFLFRIQIIITSHSHKMSDLDPWSSSRRTRHQSKVIERSIRERFRFGFPLKNSMEREICNQYIDEKNVVDERVIIITTKQNLFVALKIDNSTKNIQGQPYIIGQKSHGQKSN